MSKGRRLRAARSSVAEPAAAVSAAVRLYPVKTATARSAIDDLFRSRIFDESQEGPIVARPEQLARILPSLGVSPEEYDQAILVARSGEAVAGAIESHLPLAFLQRTPDEVAEDFKREIRLLERLAVATVFERQGVGARLVDEAAHQHAAAGATQWVAAVHHKHRSALPFYRRMGFVVFDRFSELPYPMSAIRIANAQDHDTFWIHRRF